MKRVGETLGASLARHAAELSERIERLRAVIGERGLHVHLVERFGEAAAALFPVDLTVDEFVRRIGEHRMLGIQERLAECAACPDHGGSCHRDVDKGQKPTWSHEKGLTFEECSKWAEYEFRDQLSRCGVGEVLLGARFQNYETPTPIHGAARRACLEYARDLVKSHDPYERRLHGPNLLLTGPDKGVGKTHLAVAVMAAVLRYVSPRLKPAPRFFFAADLFERTRRSFRKDADEDDCRAFEEALEAPLLVLDDIGVERPTDWVHEQIDRLANHRWSSGLITVMTTNVSSEGLNEALGERATSRLLANCDIVPLAGKDYRWRE